MKSIWIKCFFGLVLISGISGCKDLAPALEKVKPLLESRTSQQSAPSTTQMIIAMRQALSQGVSMSVKQLGADNGFALSDLYRIPVPQGLDSAASTLRKLGQGKYVDEFETRLNLAAEQSVSRAIPVFTSAIRGMSVSDVLNIMKGQDNAATVYFRQNTEARLRERFMPVIQTATSQTGLTSTYKKISDKVDSYIPAYSSKLVDIDDYVLNRALDALFDRIATEEKLIRDDPAKRSTELLKTVFGHFAK